MPGRLSQRRKSLYYAVTLQRITRLPRRSPPKRAERSREYWHSFETCQATTRARKKCRKMGTLLVGVDMGAYVGEYRTCPLHDNEYFRPFDC